MARNGAAADDELYRRLQLSLVLRVVMVIFLVGATVFNHFTSKEVSLDDPTLIPLYLLSGVTYLFTLLSLIANRFIGWLKGLAFIQITWETTFVTTLIYITTGPTESIFSFLYLLAIIVAGILLYRAGAFYAAVIGSLFYGLVLAGLENGTLPPAPPLEYIPIGWNRIIYDVFINLAAMFGMAVLSSYLTEKLRVTGDELQETQRYRDALEALNDIVVRSIPSGLITIDLAGRITSFNQAAENISGMESQRARGLHLADVFPEAAQTLIGSPPRMNDKVHRHQTIWKTPDGDHRHLELMVSPMSQANGEPLGALVVVNDDTEIRMMETKLRRADRLAAVGQLAAGIAHEIRNPLASISGSIQVLNQDLDPDPVSKKLMKIVVRETERLNDLITDFLLYARPTPKTIHDVRVDLLIQEIIEVCRHRKDVEQDIEWIADVKTSLAMATDPKLLEQILWNLVNNAVQAMPEGGTITIRAREEMVLAAPVPQEETKAPHPAESGPELIDSVVVIEVEDSGVGIPPDIRDRIFDPFFTTRENGAGLGLSTVYRVVEALDGAISVEDADGGGTRFVIKTPKRRDAGHEPASEGTPAKDNGG